MKSEKVLKILNITRATLCKYVKSGIINVKSLQNGLYSYDDESVYQLKNNNKPRKTIMYFGKCVIDRDFEILIEQYKKDHSDEVVQIINDKEKMFGEGFENLMKDISNYSIKKVVVVDEDFETINLLEILGKTLKSFGCEIQTIKSNGEADEQRICNIEQLINLLKMKINSETDQKMKDKLICCAKILTM